MLGCGLRQRKWDGFRALVFRDRDDVVLQSRNGKELGRYFPDCSTRCAMSSRRAACSTARLSSPARRRPHPAGLGVAEPAHPSRRQPGQHVAEQTPAHFIGFDALASGDRSLMDEPFRVRRQALSKSVNEKQWCHVTRHHQGSEQGAHWLTTFEGAGLDGVIAKKPGRTVPTGKRDMIKVKHARDADCVAIGYRIHKSGEGVGSILLGLYRDEASCRWWGCRVVHRQGPAEAAGRPGAAAQGGRPGLRRRAQPVERRQKALDPGAAGKGRRGGLRPDGRQHHARPAASAMRCISCDGGPTAIRKAAPSISLTRR